MPEASPSRSSPVEAATAGAAKIALTYAGRSGAWILLSDRLLQALAPDPGWITALSILKGWAFVTVTAFLLFYMVKRLVAGVASRKAQLRTLIHTIPDLIWLKDPEGVYMACNPAFERFFGMAEAEIVGRTDYDFVSREQAEMFRANDRRAMLADRPQVNEEWITFAAD